VEFDFIPISLNHFEIYPAVAPSGPEALSPSAHERKNPNEEK